MIEVVDILPEKYEAAGDVAVEGYREFYRERLGSYVAPLRDVAARAAGARVLVAVEEGEVLGTVTYVSDTGSLFAQHQREGEASIRMLSVAPKHQRRGVGRAMSIACIALARAEGKTALVLHADESMDASRRLYESLGFVREPDRDFEPDDQTMLLCYRLAL